MRLARLLVAAWVLASLMACDDEKAGPAESTPTSKGACPNSYYEDAFSSSSSLSVLMFTDHVAQVSVSMASPSGNLAADVDVVEWSHPGARPLPDHLGLDVIGCQVGHEWKAGHTYLVNLLWQPYDQTWQVVGHEGMLLYDDGLIGDLDRPPGNGAWADIYDGQDAAALVTGLQDARATYRLLLDQAWRQPDVRRRQQLYTSVHDPQQRVDPGAHRTEARLALLLGAAQVTWRGRVLRQHPANSTIGDVTLGESLDRATWWEGLAGGAEVHRARLDGREVWVLRLPDFVRSGRTLVVAVAPDGWSRHVLVPQA
ncbi:MAG: hypothetical protein ABIO16_16060 [Nocardioides sp.]